jgi:hypothetical protein
MSRTLTLFFLFIVCTECTPAKKDRSGYRINDPNDVFVLPSRLTEISGIAFISDDVLACIEDEHGILYQYSLNKREIVDEINFSSSGDFEDVAIKGDTAYVLRSDGMVFTISNFTSSPQINKFRIVSKIRRNVEGLFCIQKGGQLLIADKEDNSFCFFDLLKKELIAVSVPIERKGFSPSAIGIHPITGEIYILGSTTKDLLVVRRDGTVKTSIKLQNRLFIQPEGMTFNSAGDLFISNEGRGGKSNILMFKYHHMDEK